jgi:hypothetical protein
VRAKPREGILYSYRTDEGLIAMITGMPLETGEQLARLLVEEARKLELAADKGSLRLSLCVGLAGSAPGDEHFFETMLCVAEEGAAVASAGGGGCAVHSQLYGLHQRRLEREMPQRLAAAKLRKEKHLKRAEERLAPLAVPSSRPDKERGAGKRDARARQAQDAPRSAADPRAAQLPPDSGRIENAEPQTPLELPGVDLADETSSLHDRLRKLLVKEQRVSKRSGSARVADDLAEIESHDFSLAERWGQDLLRRGLEAQATEHRMQMALLERRLSKLDRALAESEAELRRVATTAATDYGVHSAYRSVQGLSAEEQQYELKHALMEKILAANLELYAHISGGQRSASA